MEDSDAQLRAIIHTVVEQEDLALMEEMIAHLGFFDRQTVRHHVRIALDAKKKTR